MDEKSKTKGKRFFPPPRGWIQALFFAFTNGYLAGYLNAKIYRGKLKQICVPGLNCYSCPGALYSCPIGALQAVLDSGKFRISCYVFGFFLLIGSILGRAVCGFLCPFGWIQDICYKIPLLRKRKRKNLPGHQILIKLKYLILVLFVIAFPLLFRTEYGAGVPWFCKLICPSGTLFGGVILVLSDSSFTTFISGLFWWKIGLLCTLLLMSSFIYRPFCKYLCPLGAVYSGFHKVSLFRLKVDENLCIHCGKCKEICLMGVDPEHNKGTTECISCGACKKDCPVNAISISPKGKDTFSK